VLEADWRQDLVAGLRLRLGVARTPVLVGVDGWSGSGKTSLALWLGPVLGGGVFSLEDLVLGWHGLQASVELAASCLADLAAGRPTVHPTWDWGRDCPGPCRHVPAPRSVVVVEGCGAGAARLRPWLDALVWLEVPARTRRQRLEARSDWDGYGPWFGAWEAQEAQLRADDDPRLHSDAVVVERPGGRVVVRWRTR
jgi:hypothetical protein